MAAPWLLLPAKLAHDLSQFFLTFRSRWASPQTLHWNSEVHGDFHWSGLHFENRLGIAGGVDKNAGHIRAWWSYGVGFVEVGTVTLVAQGPNPGVILRRENSRSAVWNKMGFPNQGADVALANLKKARPRATPVFINIGKNRSTPVETAANDYLRLIEIFDQEADAFVINISSPNTTGLRDLFKTENLAPFLSILRAKTRRPLLLKLSPDLSDQDFCEVLDTSLTCEFDGWIISNTTLAREIDQRTGQPYFEAAGGVSGAPLANRSKALLKLAVTHLGERRKNRLVVSAGGVSTPEDVFERLSLGADLVQVYSTLIFNGPSFFRSVAEATKGSLK